ncbi:MAG: hypothetical protein ACREBT_05205 [Thermoplasmata archaeon]
MLSVDPPPPVPLQPEEEIRGEWNVPWHRTGFESVTRLVLTNRRLVVHCVFTRAGWFAGRHARATVDLGRWQELLDAPLERLADPSFEHQKIGIGVLTELIIHGRPILIIDTDNQGFVESILPRISQARSARIAELPPERTAGTEPG